MEYQVLNQKDIINIIIQIKIFIKNIGFDETTQTMIITATSEILNNIFIYAKTGKVIINEIYDNNKKGIKIILEDNGPGIPNIKKAMKDNYSSNNTLGVGLPGAKRLMDEFDIKNIEPTGIRIIMKKWI